MAAYWHFSFVFRRTDRADSDEDSLAALEKDLRACAVERGEYPKGTCHPIPKSNHALCPRDTSPGDVDDGLASSLHWHLSYMVFRKDGDDITATRAKEMRGKIEDALTAAGMAIVSGDHHNALNANPDECEWCWPDATIDPPDRET